MQYLEMINLELINKRLLYWNSRIAWLVTRGANTHTYSKLNIKECTSLTWIMEYNTKRILATSCLGNEPFLYLFVNILSRLRSLSGVWWVMGENQRCYPLTSIPANKHLVEHGWVMGEMLPGWRTFVMCFWIRNCRRGIIMISQLKN